MAFGDRIIVNIFCSFLLFYFPLDLLVINLCIEITNGGSALQRKLIAKILSKTEGDQQQMIVKEILTELVVLTPLQWGPFPYFRIFV